MGAANSASAEVLRDQIAAEDYVDQVQAHLLTTTVSSSSNPEIEASESVYTSSSSDMEVNSHIVLALILVLLCVAVNGVCCGVYFYCKSRRKGMPKETSQTPDLV